MSGRRSILVVLPHRRYVYDLPACGTVTIGRARECQLRIDDPVVSRRHARLHVGATLRLEDLGSENGTIVEIRSGTGGERTVTTERLCGDTLELSPRTAIRLGDARLVVQEAQDAPEAPDAPESHASPRMQAVLEKAALASHSRIPVLIQGETGVGKEVLAERIHELSGRPAERFFRLSCAGLVEAPLDARLAAADQGTLFLDEIGELPPALQTRLVSVLERGQVDVRLIAATHRRLEDDVASGRFRADLFFRLYGIGIEVPPLRERGEEIVPLACRFLAEAARAERLPEPSFSAPALALLASYPWPGNLRELRHEMQRALVMAAGREEILEADLSNSLRGRAPATISSPSASTGTLEEKIFALERRELEAALSATSGNRSQAAERLGLSRQGLLNKLERHGLK
jgi:DNA-binding NtrC family response regulator